MSIIANTGSYYSVEVITIGGEFTTIFLIIYLVIALLFIDTKYWNKLVANTIDTCSGPLLLVLISIVISKIMMTI